jgi:hypothetical protein
LGTTQYNKELQVIYEGKKDRELELQDISEGRRKMRRGVLCVTFAKASLKPTITLFSNVLYTKDACQWAIIIYSGADDEVDKLCRSDALKGHTVHCRKAADALNSTIPSSSASSGFNGSRNALSAKAVPKTVLYRELLPILGTYERVLLLDEDMSLIGFDIAQYMEIWDCAFYPYRPLVTQPLISESTQYFNYLSYQTWASKGYQASASGLIEQQIPFFDASFFEWFVRRVLVHTRATALKMGADCGHDR